MIKSLPERWQAFCFQGFQATIKADWQIGLNSSLGGIAMTPEIVYRLLMFLAFIALFAIRVHYQRKVLHEERRIQVRENVLSLVSGAVAALTSLIFGAEYIFFRGAFPFTYPLVYPDWLRWLGAGFLAGGIWLLAAAHHYLGKSFHSFVVSKQGHQLVTSGPYRWVRHPIYSAYLLSYLGGGLLASNLVLTFAPLFFFSLMILDRIPREEELMRQEFGEQYQELENRTGRLLPKLPLARPSMKEDA
jgi:protein-S-isoprenylcysteine O-methyltransferase Ste14